MKKILELLKIADDNYDQILNYLKENKIGKTRYQLLAYLLGLLVVISPIIVLITLFIYHHLVYLLGLLIVIFLMLGFYLADYFFMKMLQADYQELKQIKIKPILLRNLMLYLAVGIIVYLFYYVIARMIL